MSTRAKPLSHIRCSAAFVHPCTSDYSHRKQWVIDRLRELDRVLAIEVCAFAVLSKRYHTVLYVDLNPIRAGMADCPETSEFTSIYERIRAIKKRTNSPKLRKFRGQAESSRTLPCSQNDYLALVDWTGRAIRSDKRGHIDRQLPPIFKRLNIDKEAWLQTMQPNVFGRTLGQLDHLRLHAKALGQSWIKGLRRAEQIYRTA